MADYVIVGGGIYGCAVTWELAKRGAGVLLLEAQMIAAALLVAWANVVCVPMDAACANCR